MIPDGYRFKIGDIVRAVPPPLDGGRTPGGLLVPEAMEEYYGGVYTVSSVSQKNRVTLDGVVQCTYGNEWWWDRWCLEIVPESDANFDGVEELL